MRGVMLRHLYDEQGGHVQVVHHRQLRTVDQAGALVAPVHAERGFVVLIWGNGIY